MKQKLAISICCLFLASGLLRISVGTIMLGQLEGWWALGGEAAEALVDTQRFIAEQDTNLLGFTPFSYFAFIVFMGASISAGAIGHLRRSSWGLTLIGIYLLSHAALFVNFATVNPKIVLLALATLLTFVLVWADERPANEGKF